MEVLMWEASHTVWKEASAPEWLGIGTWHLRRVHGADWAEDAIGGQCIAGIDVHVEGASRIESVHIFADLASARVERVRALAKVVRGMWMTPRAHVHLAAGSNDDRREPR